MTTQYATETTQVSAKFVTQSFVNLLNAGRTKEAADEGTAFTREIVRQEANVREVIRPVGLQDHEIDRDEDTEDPKKIVEKEPRSVATFTEIQGTPRAKYYTGPRYAVYFGKILSDKHTKNKFQLLTHVNDIRKILADNSTKDCADVEDLIWRKRCNTLIQMNPSQQLTAGAAFTSTPFKRAFQALINRRRPIGKMLMTKSLYYEAIDLPATVVGSQVAGKHYDQGIEKEDALWSVPVISSVKTDIYDTKEVWVYSPENFLGVFYTLQDATLFIKQEADWIEFFIYEVLGIGIGNRLSMQKIEFPAS